MAFQRPFLISLKRGDSSLRWGFSIHGGKDYGESLRIQMVTEDSLAEKFGLHEGDEVIQVGRVNVQDLTLGQVHELLARCGNKIEMFVVREDLLTPRKGKEPPFVKAVVHNPYNSPLSLYSTENIADTLAKQTEVLTEGHVSAEEDEGPESLSFKQKSAVFQILEEQAKQDNVPHSRQQSVTVKKPKTAPPPPPPPKPKSPSEALYNGHDSSQQKVYQDQQRSSSHIEYQTTQKTGHQYHQDPTQYQQTSVHQTYNQHPLRENISTPRYPSDQCSSTTLNYQQAANESYYQQSPAVTHQKPQYQSPPVYKTLNQSNYQQQKHQTQTVYRTEVNQSSQKQQPAYQKQVQHSQQHQQHYNVPEPTPAVSKAEFKIRPAPPPRVSSAVKQDKSEMAAVYKQQYEQHLQKQQEEQQRILMGQYDEEERRRVNLVKGEIFEHNSTSGTPITYKAPPTAPPKPHWPPPLSQTESFQTPPSPTSAMDIASVWPPKKSTAVELPRTGFNPAAVREQGNGRRCVWPPPSEDFRSGRNTPQSPVSGRRIHWNPSPSPPTNRRGVFSSQSPSRRRDIQWPPTQMSNGYDKENFHSPRLSRKARFDEYVTQHASVNVPQTYRPPPGTQHVEFR